MGYVGIIKNLESFDNAPKTIKDFYDLLFSIVKEWSDVEELQQKIIAIWIIGTYVHDKFISYPYLFLNAMKQSGKSRLLKLLSVLCRRGKHISNITEASLFRMPTINKGVTLCIDEAENLNSMEKSILRGLLNTGYKKGVFIPRVKRLMNGESIIEEFSVYTPIAIANITGIDDVLEDRCITILLERSTNLNIIMRTELFEYDEKIKFFQSNCKMLLNITEHLNLDNFYLELNKKVDEIINTILKTNILEPIYPTVDTLLDTNYTSMIMNMNCGVSSVSSVSDVSSVSSVSSVSINVLDDINLNTIIKTGIYGRNLEIWLPIFILAKMIDEELLNTIIEYAGKTVIEKQDIDLSENRDTIFLDFLYNNDQFHINFIEIKDIVEKYKENSTDMWFSNNWVSRALRRHKLILERRRTGNKKFLRLDINKINNLAKNLNLKKSEQETTQREPIKETLDGYL